MASGLHHVREGAGPPLVLLAGIGSSGEAWNAVVPRLAREREVWRVDLPGFGRSEPFPPGEPCGLEALTDAAQHFFDKAGLELARRDAVASVTALSPAGFARAPGQLFAGQSLKLTYWLSGKLRPVAPK